MRDMAEIFRVAAYEVDEEGYGLEIIVAEGVPEDVFRKIFKEVAERYHELASAEIKDYDLYENRIDEE